ncbi:MAG: TIGR01906 family membrane protein [Clostridia bacterium]|nr:TIGR01906 family membrane protein [Clostridia bacterium]
MPKLTQNRMATVLFTVSLFLFIITFSIGLPIYFRPFYYWHIKPLGLTDSGFTAVQIKTAYNSVLNYLTLPGYEFSVGDMKYTADGAAHFADCKALFSLNAWVLIISAVILAVLLLLRKKGKISGFYIGKAPATLCASGTAAGIVAVLAAVVAVDFNGVFRAFHKVFFAGKDNWIFNERKDQIINVLPKEFFANCAILICCSIVLFFVAFFVVYIIKRRKGRA